MSNPHVHAALIHAWAEGARIEHWDPYSKVWWESSTPEWNELTQYRVKQEPKPDIVKYMNAWMDYTSVNKDVYSAMSDYLKNENLKLTFDGETGKLKTAEVL
jgi:hypothetical protein